MPRATECLLDGKIIGVENALHWKYATNRDTSLKPDFRCVECGQAVRPHRDGGHSSAHFEHFRRNPDCSKSDPERN